MNDTSLTDTGVAQVSPGSWLAGEPHCPAHALCVRCAIQSGNGQDGGAFWFSFVTQVALALAESSCPLEDLGLALNEVTPQGEATPGGGQQAHDQRRT